MSIRYCQFCPVSKAAEVLGERWTILILRELLMGTTRFRDFQRGLSRISPTLLTRRFRQLQEAGLVTRSTGPQRRHPEYRLTPAGRELRPVVLGLGKWGMKWARGQMSEEELDVQLLMQEFSRRIDATQLPGGPTVIQFVFSRLPKFAHWWIVLDGNGGRELCAVNPGRTEDLRIRTDVRTMVEFWAGDTPLRAAVQEGRLQLTGSAELIRTLASWLRGSVLAHVRPRRASGKG